MKTLEKILGLSAILIMLVGFLIRFNFIASTITLVLFFLSMIYFGFSFALLNNIRLRHIFKQESYKGISALRFIGSILVGFVFSILCIGILFKFQLWPNGTYTLLIGLINLGILLIISAVRLIISKDKFYKNLLIRISIIGIIGLIFFSLSYEKILELKYRDDPEYMETEKKSMRDFDNLKLRQKASEERQKMQQD